MTKASLNQERVHTAMFQKIFGLAGNRPQNKLEPVGQKP